MDFVIVTALPLHTAFRHMKNFKGRKFCKMFREISRGKQQFFRTHVGGQKCGYKPSMARLFSGAWTLTGTNKGNSAISQEKRPSHLKICVALDICCFPSRAAGLLWTSIIAL